VFNLSDASVQFGAPYSAPSEKKAYVRPRNVNLAFRVTEEERAMIEKRMAQAGTSNLRAYIVKMAIDGRVIHVELESVREMVRLLSNATNNIKMPFSKLIQYPVCRTNANSRKTP